MPCLNCYNFLPPSFPWPSLHPRCAHGAVAAGGRTAWRPGVPRRRLPGGRGCVRIRNRLGNRRRRGRFCCLGSRRCLGRSLRLRHRSRLGRCLWLRCGSWLGRCLLGCRRGLDSRAAALRPGLCGNHGCPSPLGLGLGRIRDGLRHRLGLRSRCRLLGCRCLRHRGGGGGWRDRCGSCGSRCRNCRLHRRGRRSGSGTSSGRRRPLGDCRGSAGSLQIIAQYRHPGRDLFIDGSGG